LYIGASTGSPPLPLCITNAARKAITAFRILWQGLVLVFTHCVHAVEFCIEFTTVLTVPVAIVVADVAVFDMTCGDVAAMGADFVAI